jgi:hypothetical protein
VLGDPRGAERLGAPAVQCLHAEGARAVEQFVVHGVPRWLIMPLIELDPPSTLPRAW